MKNVLLLLIINSFLYSSASEYLAKLNNELTSICIEKNLNVSILDTESYRKERLNVVKVKCKQNKLYKEGKNYGVRRN
jgi:hypothetical protein